jgi:hypothetical protein
MIAMPDVRRLPRIRCAGIHVFASRLYCGPSRGQALPLAARTKHLPQGRQARSQSVVRVRRHVAGGREVIYDLRQDPGQSACNLFIGNAELLREAGQLFSSDHLAPGALCPAELRNILPKIWLKKSPAMVCSGSEAGHYTPRDIQRVVSRNRFAAP